MQDADYNILVIENSDKTFSFKLPKDLEDIQSDFEVLVHEKKPRSILEFLRVLKDKIKQHKSTTIPINNCDKYRHVLREYSEVTRFFLDIKSFETSVNLNTAKFSTLDDCNREHVLELKVNWDGDMQDIFEVVNFDLPLPKDSFKSTKSLREIYEQFRLFIEKLQPFFELMENIDQFCWVLDPVPPIRNCKYRRICIGKLLKPSLFPFPSLLFIHLLLFFQATFFPSLSFFSTISNILFSFLILSCNNKTVIMKLSRFKVSGSRNAPPFRIPGEGYSSDGTIDNE